MKDLPSLDDGTSRSSVQPAEGVRIFRGITGEIVNSMQQLSAIADKEVRTLLVLGLVMIVLALAVRLFTLMYRISGEILLSSTEFAVLVVVGAGLVVTASVMRLYEFKRRLDIAATMYRTADDLTRNTSLR